MRGRKKRGRKTKLRPKALRQEGFRACAKTFLPVTELEPSWHVPERTGGVVWQPSGFIGAGIASARSGRALDNRHGMWQHRKAGLGVVGGVLGLVSGSVALLSGTIGVGCHEPDCRAPT